MTHTEARILRSFPEQQDYQVIVLSAPEIASQARAGQFVHLRVNRRSSDPLLRRPISILLADPQAGEVRLLVRKVGRGTELLAEMAEGAAVDLLGPLGNGFDLPQPGRDILLVAGGVGVAPLIYLADVLQQAHDNFRVRGLFGGASQQHLPLWTEFAGRCEEFYVSTEDGSAGEQGLVTDLLTTQLARGDAQAVYTCGPRPMMAAVARQCAEAGLPCYASLEQWMGCGVGACLGCVVPGTGDREFVRVCKDGPVFKADEIAWEKL